MLKKITLIMLVALFIFSCVTTQDDINRELRGAAYQGDLTRVKELVEEGGDFYLPDSFDTNAFHSASKAGHYEVVQFFISVDPSEINMPGRFGSTALRSAVFNGHYDIVQLLLDNGADINEGSQDYISASLINKDIKALKFFIEDQKIDPATEKYLLIKASMEEFWEAIPYLVDNGVDINELEGKKRSVLRYANSHSETISFLIENGADINNIPNDGVPPLTSAILNGNYEAAYLYLDAGADLEPEDPDNDPSNGTPLTPLLAIVLSKNDKGMELAQTLVNYGADIDYGATDDEGKTITPLTLAVMNQNIDMVRFFIDAGASKELSSSLGSPLDMAIEKENQEIIDLLK